MKQIIEKYFLEKGSKLVKYIVGTNGVDCWFDTDNVRQHRCLEYNDFKTLTNYM